jgi:quercetin dioxygenase-like cupin family protein
MTLPYQFLENITDPAAIPAEGILSRTIHDDERVRAVLFGFAPGEELSEHTASMPAIIHILYGEAHLTLGEATMDVSAGAWAHMAANLSHSVHARTPVAMLLLMLKNPA